LCEGADFLHKHLLTLDVSNVNAIRLANDGYGACVTYAEPYTKSREPVIHLKLNFLILKLSKDLVAKVISNETSMHDLLYTDTYELIPWLRQEQEELKTQQKDIEMPSLNIYKCPNCKERDHTIYHVQTRSIDEPQTVKATCNVCGRTWTV
jgi:DNA-directed RNA polymerase subunit M/transcription elongation factor TFIIS